MKVKVCLSSFFLASAMLLSPSVLASGSSPIRLEPVHFNADDMASVKRGAKAFATQCMVCHAMQYLGHNKIAHDAGVLIEKMPKKGQDWWFGAAPPDLSLTARSRSPRWIYTYLHTFYKDSGRKSGTNNLLVHNSSMPNPFGATQGDQVLVASLDNLNGAKSVYAPKPRYFSVLRLERQGSLDSEEFHQQIHDLVNFMIYASDPGQKERKSLGFWVLGFLLILIVLTYLLKKEYWRDIE